MQVRAEHLDHPLGIGEREPRLSWRLPEGAGRQLAYEVALDDGTSQPRRGRRERARAVAGQGAGLGRTPRGAGPRRDGRRGGRVVRAARRRGRAARARRLAGRVDLAGRGGRPGGAPAGVPAARRGAVDRPVVRARLYATAHGLYEASVNGQRVGSDELTPGYTEYAARTQVQTYDVTVAADARRARPRGAARRRVVPRPGRACCAPPTSGARRRRSWPSCTRARGRHDHGRRHRCDWRWAPSHITRGRPDRGAARGPAAARGRPRSGRRSVVSDRGYDALVCSPAPPVRPVEELRPVSVTELRPGDPGRRPRPEHQRPGAAARPRPGRHRAHPHPRRGARRRRRRDHRAPAARTCRSCPSR